MSNRLKYPIGTQDFATLREFGYVYIDKTKLIYDLVNNNRYVFLSRPRRFGKSLLLSTIRYYFEGRKDLFDNLALINHERNWFKYPVLHLELSRVETNNPNSLKDDLDSQFSLWEKQYNVTTITSGFSQRFSNIILSAYQSTRKRVVILIDEYDNPLLNNIHNLEVYELNRNLLKSLYSNLKVMDEYIQFAMLTGVSRFSNTSIFSGLNNIQDITLLDDYATICGFTKEEIKKYLWEGVESLAVYEGCSNDEALRLLKEEYDGYHFSEKLIDIYNPFSLLNCLSTSRINDYWMKSGVPEFIVDKLEDSRESFERIFNSQADTYSLEAKDSVFDSPVSLMFQTGYLTIKGYNRKDRIYTLGVPNKEVDRSLFLFMLGSYSRHRRSDGGVQLREMSKCLYDGNPEEFIRRLQSLLAGITYELQGKFTELDYEKLMYVALHILGFYCQAEFRTSYGRIDLLVETKDYVYVMELKLDKSPEEALAQINGKDYTLSWKFDGRKIFKIGISFSSVKRNIDSWLIE